MQGGGCFWDAAEATSGQVFLNEVFASFTMLYLAFGVGLDPRQAILFGPKLGPILVGVALGIMSFASSGTIPGYTGAQMNPARCFAFGVARRSLSGMPCSPLALFALPKRFPRHLRWKLLRLSVR